MADARPEAEPEAPEGLSPRPSTAKLADAAGAAPPVPAAAAASLPSLSSAARGTAGLGLDARPAGYAFPAFRGRRRERERSGGDPRYAAHRVAHVEPGILSDNEVVSDRMEHFWIAAYPSALDLAVADAGRGHGMFGEIGTW